jgi:glycosyltransferase involved in cell wall biosynthesis
MRAARLSDLPPARGGRVGWPWDRGAEPLADLMPDGSAWPTISIVTPSLNQGDFLEETIRSVLLQGYPALEYFVVDGGSTDQTVDILRRYEPWLAGWTSEPDRGQSDAINKGLERCSGSIFNWLNSDDFYEPDALRQVALGFARPEIGASHPEIGVVAGRERRFGESTAAFIHPGSTVLPTAEQTVFKGHNVQPCTFFRTEFVRRVGGVAVELHYLMDADLLMRYVLLHGQEAIIKIEAVLSNFRLHPQSKTVSRRPLFEDERWSVRCSLATRLGLPAGLVESTRKLFHLSSLRDWPLAASFSADAYLTLYAEELLRLHQALGDLGEQRRCFRFIARQRGLAGGRAMTRELFRLYVRNALPWRLLRRCRSALRTALRSRQPTS